jgi:hypothetical protein
MLRWSGQLHRHLNPHGLEADFRDSDDGRDVRIRAALVATVQQAVGTAGVFSIQLSLGGGIAVKVIVTECGNRMDKLVRFTPGGRDGLANHGQQQQAQESGAQQNRQVLE